MKKISKKVMCRNCGTSISKKTAICPSCGVKNKLPFYKRWWYIVFIVMVVAGTVNSIKRGSDKKEFVDEEILSVSLTGTEETEDTGLEENNQTNLPNDENISASDQSTDEDKTLEDGYDCKIELVDGIRPEFKQAMDSYEAFFDEYVAFMNRYSESNNDLEMVSDYMQYLGKYTEAMEKLGDIDEQELNDAELIYYTEVMARITQKTMNALR